jgi:superfamily II DNA or RNA helicase
MAYAVGSLVQARGREWVVLPGSAEDLLLVRPLGGTEEEVTGLLTGLEPVEPARFDLPDPAQPGDYRSSRLLRDAVRIGFRSSAGPFRSFARLAVEPRPYQLVPLLLALKLDPVRMLIADDVGIGKTIEAALIARELLDRGEIERMAVLCSPQLATQWQRELREKFHIEAEVVLPGTAPRLERHCRLNESLFDRHPFVIVSTDFIKTERRRDEFRRTCPELVIVDEAHTCASGWEGRSGRHQRYDLLQALAADPQRHLLLVTATPHSGNEAAFRSLLTLLDPGLADLPEDLMGPKNEPHRRRLAARFVQRRRGDIRGYLDAETPFPEREEDEHSWGLSKEYRQLFERVLGYAREVVREAGDGQRYQQRVRWWSVLSLLRSLASSPAAAVATLRTRAASADATTVEEADQLGRRTVLDLTDEEAGGSLDLLHGADPDQSDPEERTHRRLLEMARQAEALLGAKDSKLEAIFPKIAKMIEDGAHPIIFCRFIPTAEYLAEQLRRKLRGVEVDVVTGNLPPEEREERVRQLGQAERRLLVATDCLSEGINLQENFDAVVHYDLSWNPARHEQREGRVDRYGQKQKRVRVLTCYGRDNQIDGLVLDILLRKHRLIRNSLGISIPVPVDADQVIEAVLEGLLLRSKTSAEVQPELFPELVEPEKQRVYRMWEAVEEREKRSRTMFAQESIKVEEVARELREVRAAIGSGVELGEFVRMTLRAAGAIIVERDGNLEIDLAETPLVLRQALTEAGHLRGPHLTARFELPISPGQLHLTRTHPIVEALAGHVIDTTLDPLLASLAHRCGVIRTGAVERRTTLLLVRYRFHLLTRRDGVERPLLAEDCRLLGFAGPPDDPQWLEDEAAEALLAAVPEANIAAAQQTEFLRKVVDGFDHLRPHLDKVAAIRAQDLLESHRRVRQASRTRSVSHRVEPQLPADLLGVFILLPIPGKGKL